MRSRQWLTRTGSESAGAKARPRGLPGPDTLVAGAASPEVQVSPGCLPAGPALLAVQRQYGNQFAQRLLQTPSGQRPPGPVPRVQPMLRLGSPRDRYERQADAVARRVTGHWPGKGSATRDDEGDPKASLGLEAPVRHLAGGGQPLARTVAGPMEQAFGTDFGHVRVHSDAGSHDLCRSFGARALTVGDHIFFRRGEQPSGSTSGRHLLAHELTHVVQQRGIAPPGGGANGYGEPASIASAPRGIIQPFWVRRYGKFYWRRSYDSYKFFRLNGVTHSSRNHPGEQPVYVEPWEKPQTKLQIEPATHRKLLKPAGREKLLGKLREGVIPVLRKIRSTGIGSRLLRNLAAKAPEKTIIMPQRPGPDPKTTAYPGESRIELQVKRVYDAWAFLASEHGRVEVDWRKMPSDVVLFHELVHAYHDVHHTTADGTVRDAEAENEVDVGVNRREYQAVGLDAQDGAFHYANELFTENKYRRARGLPLRTTYMVPYRGRVPLARRSSFAAEDADERASASE